LPWGLSGEANLRGLASLTKTNTRRDASCAASPAQISYLASNEAQLEVLLHCAPCLLW